jgi:hypothetical protein
MRITGKGIVFREGTGVKAHYGFTSEVRITQRFEMETATQLLQFNRTVSYLGQKLAILSSMSEEHCSQGEA